MTTMTPEDWRQLRQELLDKGPGAAGYYNFNHRARVDGQEIVVRIPIAGCDEMDLRVWPEAMVIAAVRRSGIRAPAVLYSSFDPPFSILEYIEGDRLDRLAPKGWPLPSHVVHDMVDTIRALHEVPAADLPPAPPEWPRDGDTAGFFRLLVDTTQSAFDRHKERFERLYRALGVPSDPLEAIRSRAKSLARRPFRALHCDLHRKNLIVRDRETWVLDWELALWGDPVYELAVHVHKMGYLPHERQRFFEAVSATLNSVVLCGMEPDLGSFLAHEQCKSAIVDSVRYAKQARDPSTPPALFDSLCEKLAGKLATAQETWESSEAPDVDKVRNLLLSAP